MRTFVVDISKFEYCRPKSQKEFDSYTIYAYTPAMLAIENYVLYASRCQSTGCGTPKSHGQEISMIFGSWVLLAQ